MMYFHDYYFEPGFFQGNDPDVKLRKLNVSGHHTLFYKYCCNPARYEEYAFCFQQEFLAMTMNISVSSPSIMTQDYARREVLTLSPIIFPAVLWKTFSVLPESPLLSRS